MQREFDPSRSRRSLIDALVEAAQTYGANKPILEDQERNPLSYTDLTDRCSGRSGPNLRGQ
jgi:acyl-[acyl-carrier-protein]-phospholipid O-acyltransferase/long-chain-fatty-acid--[acyl-carrier-protein] ligase